MLFYFTFRQQLAHLDENGNYSQSDPKNRTETWIYVKKHYEPDTVVPFQIHYCVRL